MCINNVHVINNLIIIVIAIFISLFSDILGSLHFTVQRTVPSNFNKRIPNL